MKLEGHKEKKNHPEPSLAYILNTSLKAEI
jgi:hypothetical protein